MRRAGVGLGRRARLVVVLLLLATAQSVVAQEAVGASFPARFDTAWRLVAERYWDLGRVGVDWDEVGARYRPEALAATDDAAFFRVLERMYEELGDDHSVFVPPDRVAEIRQRYGDLPCVAVFGRGAPAPTRAGAPGASSGAPGASSGAPGAFSGAHAGEVDSLGVGDVIRAWGQQGVTTQGTIANVTFGRTPDGIGYLRLPDLASDGAAAAVRSAVEQLERGGARALVLDLRGNPGGRLVTMMQVAGVFTGGLLWRAVMRWTFPMPYPAIGAAATTLPLAILIDGDVHSAAEGLAGGLQATGRATVIGEVSAGNVEAVLPFCLRDGSQAWIATGVLAPLWGPTWEGRGVVPDVPSSTDDALEAALGFLRRSTP